MSDTNAVAELFLRKANETGGHAGALGFQFVALDDGSVVLKTPYKPELVGDPETGVLAGGVVTALLDHVSGQAVFAACGDPGSIATLDLRIDYMRGAKPGLDLYARAHCYKVTRSVAFVRATAYESDPDDPLATAQAAFMLNANAGRVPGANMMTGR
jgi:uncharacterized protein (TIGR00369 family)